MPNPITAILGGIAKPVVDALSSRSERKHEKRLADLVAKENVAQRAADAAREAQVTLRQDKKADVSWEQAAWEHSGWKDELNTLALWVFFFLSALPIAAVQQSVAFAVQTFKDWPMWLQVIFIAHSLASIGIRFQQASKFRL